MHTRKRKRNPEEWKRNVSKKIVNTGQAGYSVDDRRIKKRWVLIAEIVASNAPRKSVSEIDKYIFRNFGN